MQAAQSQGMCPAETVIVIPARLNSSRLPRKLLLKGTGRTILEHTYEAACQARRADRCIIATDSQDILDVARSIGAEAVMTNPLAPSGTDRVAEVARTMPHAKIFVNVQGDEPEIDPAAIDLAIELLADPQVPMATLATPIRDFNKVLAPSCVKVVFDAHGDALYFSRSIIPHVRDGLEAAWESGAVTFYQHLGLYAYRRDFLLQLGQLAPSPLEQAEKLEQLRVLEHGHCIRIGLVEHSAAGIDTPSDYEAFLQRWVQRTAPARRLAG